MATFEFPYDILDYIFALLKSDPESLIACSTAYPSFSPIVEKYLYHRIVIHTFSAGYRTTCHGYHLELSRLLELLSETPQIANHVCVLQLTFSETNMTKFEQIARILPLFPLVRCIILRSIFSILWKTGLPQSLRMAVENCLRLPTMQEIQIGGFLTFPLSLLNKHADITCLSFSAHPQMPDCPDDTYPPLQLKSLDLTVLHDKYSDHITTWIKPHITTLRSLQCQYSNERLLERVDICSGTLNNLDLELRAPYGTSYYINSGRVYAHTPLEPLIDLSSLLHLQHLTIRVLIYDVGLYSQAFCVSCLPAAVKILKTASSSLQHLTLEIDLEPHDIWHKVDLSPLTMLVEASASFQRLDLYTMIPFANAYERLARYEGLNKLIKQDRLVIFAEQSAPGISQFD